MRTCGFIILFLSIIKCTFAQNATFYYTLTCISPCITLDALPTHASKLVWKGPNGFQSNELKPKVCAAGEYQVNYINDGVALSALFLVEDKKYTPTANIVGDENLTCIFNCRNLHGFDPGADYGAVWYGPNGFVQNSTAINICKPGRYIYKIFKGVCHSSDTIYVKDAKIALAAHAGSDITLNCKQTTNHLMADLPSKETNYEWLLDGKIYSKQAQPKVTKKGSYIFKVKQGVCEAQDTVEVVEDFERPTLHGANTYTITCKDKVATSSIQCSSNEAKFEWRNENAEVIATALNATLNTSGNYALRSYLERNGCSDDKNITILPKNGFTFALNTTDACGTEANGAINIENIIGGTAPYAIALKDVTPDFKTEKTIKNLKKGTYEVVVRDSEGCEQHSTATIGNERQLSWSVPELYRFCSYHEPLQLDVTLQESNINDVTYLWQDGNTTAQRAFTKSIKTWVEISTSCFKARQNIEIIDEFERIKEMNFYTPNVFNPLSTNAPNRCFKPYIAFPIKDYELKIFDRWGNLVFHTTESDACWDGTHRGKPLFYGMFFWQVTAKLDACGNPVPWQKSGGIAIFTED
jgi:gliding motility-associated-like protein